MANGIFNNALGRMVEKHHNVTNDAPTGCGFTWVILKASEADTELAKHTTLAALLGAAGNTECDATNYARVDVTGVTAPNVDQALAKVTLDLPDPTFSTLGGAANNAITKIVLVYFDDVTGGADSTGLPLCHWDYTYTTSGIDFTPEVSALGYYTESNS